MWNSGKGWTPKDLPPFDPGAFEIDDSQSRLTAKDLHRERPTEVKWYVRVQGSCVECKRILPDYLSPECSPRGNIGPLSKSSRMNLLRYVNQIDYDFIHGISFVTLTYPDGRYRNSYRKRGQDRYQFLRSVETYKGYHVPSLWRCEWMPRLTGKFVGKLFPHWHLLLFGVKVLDEEWVRATWARIVKHKGEFVSVKVKQVYGEMGAVKYLSKYVSKSATLDIAVYHNNRFKFGRAWGVTRKELIPVSPVVILRKLTKDEIAFARSYAAMVLPNYDQDNGDGFTLFSPHAAEMFRLRLNPYCEGEIA